MPVHVERPHDMWRVTLTTLVLNAAGDVALLVAGADKATRLHEVLEERGERRLPVQRIRPRGGGALHWMIDKDAAAQLRGVVT